MELVWYPAKLGVGYTDNPSDAACIMSGARSNQNGSNKLRFTEAYCFQSLGFDGPAVGPRSA